MHTSSSTQALLLQGQVAKSLNTFNLADAMIMSLQNHTNIIHEIKPNKAEMQTT